MKVTAITLSGNELERLRRIIAEADTAGALKFVREVLEEKVKANELPHCVPVFDVGYNPGQDESFKRGH